MADILWMIFELFSNTLDSILFIYLLNRKLDRGFKDWKKDSIFVILIVVLLTYFNENGYSYAFTLALFFIAFEIYSICFKEGTLFSRIIWPIVAHTIYFCANQVNILLLSFIPNLNLEDLTQRTPTRIIMVTFYMLMVFVVFNILARPKISHKVLPRWMQVALVVLALGSIIFAGIVFDLSPVVMENPDSAFVLALSTTGFFVMSVVCFLLFDQMAIWSTKNFELQSQVIRAEEEQKNLENLLTNQELIRELRHDMKHHFDVLSVYLNSNRFSEAMDYLVQLQGDFEPAQHLFLSGHSLIDALLSAKIHQAKSICEETEIKLSLPEVLSLSETDICSIFGNILDNAIEAVQKIPVENRYIQMETTTVKGMWVIHLVNSCNGEYLRKSSSFFSSTKDGDLHGIGLKRIHDIVHSNMGRVVLEPLENSFSITIYLPVVSVAEGR